MYQVKAQVVSGRRVLAGGKWLTTIGNRNVQAGDLIWTDGRCVYGHETEGGTVSVIAEQQIGIPFDSYYCYYTFAKGRLHFLADNYKGRYLLPAGNHVYYVTEKSNIIAANKRQGKTYKIVRSYSEYDNRLRNYVIGVYIYCNQEQIFVLAEDELEGLYQQEEQKALAWITPLDYNNLQLTDYTRRVTCTWGFIEHEQRWAIILSVGIDQNYRYRNYEGNERFGYKEKWENENAFSESMYYYTPEGQTLLFHTEGRHGAVNQRFYSKRKNAVIDVSDYFQLFKTSYETGCEGIHFPIQDGYYYTMKAVPVQGWVFSMPQVAWITIFSSTGTEIFAGYFYTGSYFTIYSFGQKRYLLGVNVRRVTMMHLIELVGDYPSYTGPDITDDDVIDGGLYLCQEGKLQSIAQRCYNLRLQKLKNARGWQKKLIRLE